MTVNLTGSWLTSLSAGRLVAMAGVALEGGLPASLGGGYQRVDAAGFQSSATGAARSISVIAHHEDDHWSVFPTPVVQSADHKILSAELFRSSLIRERKRADRFDEVFAVLTVEAVDRLDPSASSMLPVAAVMLARTARETDLVGWLDQNAVVALMLPELTAMPAQAAAEVEARIVGRLASQLGGSALAKLKVRLHVHSGLGGHDKEGLEADPLVAEIQSRRARSAVRDSFKRALDVVFSLALLILLSPVFLLIAVLVKLSSSGPVLFRQERVGEMAKPFIMFKFRSMSAAAAPELHKQFVSDFIKSGGQGATDAEPFFKIKSDPRVTSIGRLLRRTSLDELPQLWNVLKGDMSLVGPRPPLDYELEQYRSWHWRRVLEAKPGMTGLWQVEGRSRTTFDEMVRLDLRYARRQSLSSDLRILLATPRAVVTGRGAC